MAIEIVDLAINSMVIFHSYVSLPEGISDSVRFTWSTDDKLIYVELF